MCCSSLWARCCLDWVSTRELPTYCRICEPLCGLIATVEDGRLIQLRADKEHPLSRGNACPKGIAFTEIQNDPDRVLYPLRRTAAGEFERVSWETALDEIGERLRGLIAEHGMESLGWYFGNPSSFSYSHTLWMLGFQMAAGLKHVYSAGSQDVNNRFVASQLLYGSATSVPVPDLDRTDFLLMLGANPLVSHGSVMSVPRIREKLTAITKRGGRVVVVDPRNTETAKLFEHVGVRADGDAWLLAALLQVIFDEGLEDADALRRQAAGVRELRNAVRRFTPEATAEVTGLEPDRVRALARDLARAESAAVYGRTGTCLGRHATLVAFLIDALALVTGNLDRPGGSVFGKELVAVSKLNARVGFIGYGKNRSRIGGFPDVLGTFPAAIMAKEITTPGPGRLRALLTSAGNPVSSVPNGRELAAALDQLDLFVSIDLYVNDTNRTADYVLPATAFLERDDIPLPFTALSPPPYTQYTERVVEPYGEAREEWRIIDDLATRIGVQPFAIGPARAAGRALSALRRRVPRLPARPTPTLLADLALRTGPYGDLFGLRRGGLSLRMLRRHPHGVVLADAITTGVLREVVQHKGGRVRLDPDEIMIELATLADRPADPTYPLRVIGLRELKSHNSWMHNVEPLMRGDREHAARINPKDAAVAGISDGDRCRVTSPHGCIEVTARLTEDMTEGSVAIPHGWGHRGGWQRANAAGGANVNVNDLMSTEVADVERLAGMSNLNGVPIRLDPVG
ncbi:molybdopterin-dependent oxidoreductase [Nocardia seriolae]|nr:molybdopterin-dependent oxidoreductase [Nocardia seriolae]GEM22901.1 formate dehydrogenase [Nocardia seriolae NBRC 15557]MTJ72694.1 molybdopterin-dependent oxidoreductase [Nocardia seriolae]MTJ85498.1 molybdopterin-dependent oxidoreductase [Nocardia seriolae]MTK29496.1 molybdopterin-dependent oxidoreductase [Nocardia seriolae]